MSDKFDDVMMNIISVLAALLAVTAIAGFVVVIILAVRSMS